jgi:hypothetical protein
MYLMLKKLMRLIVFSSLMVLTTWSKTVSAMEIEVDDIFYPICHKLNDSSRMAFRLTYKRGAIFVESAYTKDMKLQGLTHEWDHLAISNTMRYYLSKHVCNVLWFLNKWYRSTTLDVPTGPEKANFYLLCSHIDRIHDFVNKEMSTMSPLFPTTSEATNVHWGEFIVNDTLTAKNIFNYILSFPGNEQTLKVQTTCLRIQELRDHIFSINDDGESYSNFWFELINIDPHLTYEDFKNAKEAYVDETINWQMLCRSLSSWTWYCSSTLSINIDEFTTLRDLVKTLPEDETLLHLWNKINKINSPNLYTALCMVYMAEKENPSESEILKLKEHYFSSSWERYKESMICKGSNQDIIRVG